MTDLIFTPDAPAHDTAQALTRADVFPFDANIKRDLILLDYQELRVQGWWDYRFMRPVEKSMLYAEKFGEVSRRLYARDIDSEKAEFMFGSATAQGFARQSLSGKTDAKAYATAVWRGRQIADALEMPYEVYIEEAMSLRLRYWQGSYTRNGKTYTGVMPKPSQIYTGWIVEGVENRWHELKAAKIHYASHDAYKAENYSGLAVQDAYVDWLIGRARATVDFERTVGLMIQTGKLPGEAVQARLGAEAFARVRSSLS